jgi:hypothetical protein
MLSRCALFALLTVAVAARCVIGDDEQPSAAGNAALEAYLLRLDEIERVAAQRKAEARAQLMRALGQAAQFEAESGTRYRGMLGSYFNQQGRIPFVMLSVPNGENVLGENARRAFNGRYDMSQPLVTFQARGHVVVPSSGSYYLETSRGYADFKLNELGYALGTPGPGNRVGAEVELTEGVYQVDFSVNNNGGQMPEALVRIIDKETGLELPIFVYASELENFAHDQSFGVELIETSNWSAEEQRLD